MNQESESWTVLRGAGGTQISHKVKMITSLVTSADRSCFLKVAGPAAMLVAKVRKIEERLEDQDIRRQEQLPKDTFDIYRSLRAIDTAELASEFGLLQSREISGYVTSSALSTFQVLFGSRSGISTRLLVRSVGALEEEPAFIIESSVAFSRELLEAASK